MVQNGSSSERPLPRSEAALKAFHDATDSLLTSSSETPLWEGAFIEALDQSLFDSKAAFIKRGFGRYVKISGNVKA